ncbi:MAG: molybdopterin synthase catalytic subunit MoaE [Gammaproteobacteria bacterium]|nr:molybdopterin synthase catalytic subunit MoaE [Gammaproteobacteria bacterium]
MKISIQQEDFDITHETQLLREANSNIGAIVTFSGLVRDLEGARKILSLTLEHYPGMTETSLEKIITEARSRWSIQDATVIHRIGEMKAEEQIVFVAVASLHRHDAFSACEFIMDYLKTRAPFWKKCRDESGESWVETKASDQEADERW